MDPWQTLHDQFQALWFNRDFSAALQTATDELAAARQTSDEHPGIIRAWLDLGLAYQANDQTAKAAQAKAEAHAITARLEAIAAQHPDTLRTADFLLFDADRLWNLEGDRPDVLEKFKRVIDIREAQAGPYHSSTAQAIARLAEVEDVSARFDEAETLYRQALVIFDTDPTTDDPYRQKSWVGLGRTLMQLDRPAEAWPYLEKAVASAGFEKTALYALLITAAACRRALGDVDGSGRLEARALALLPKANPGAEGFHV